jgi:hypothetical protein
METGRKVTIVLTHKERVIRGSVASEHVVQLFDVVDSLGPGVATFLSRGLEADGSLLVVARPQHAEAIKIGLADLGYDPAALAADGRLTLLDARDTMRQFMRGGLPDRVLFEHTVGDSVRRLVAGSKGQLHAYGEMMDILAEEGSYQAVDALEGLWNELGAIESFSLLCGYASSHFAAPRAGERLRAICQHHTRVDRGHDDMLGNWLLITVSDPSAA